MAYLTRWPGWLTCLCAVMNDSWGLGSFQYSGKLRTLPPPSVLWCFSLLLFFFSPLFSCLYQFGFIFPLSFPVWLCSFFLFLSALRLHCQHFTLNFQLLAGHSLVIPFRTGPFMQALKQPFKLHSQPPSELPLCKMLFSNNSGATT